MTLSNGWGCSRSGHAYIVVIALCPETLGADLRLSTTGLYRASLLVDASFSLGKRVFALSRFRAILRDPAGRGTFLAAVSCGRNFTSPGNEQYKYRPRRSYTQTT